MRFGLYPEGENPKRFWGARAIFTKAIIDIPWDRKNFEGQKEDSEDFINWINTEFFPVLEKNKRKLYNNQSEIFHHSSEDDRFFGKACCNTSYGYLYIGCWEARRIGDND